MMRKIFLYLASIEIWVVGFGVAASFASERFLPLVVGIIVFFGLIRWVAYGRFSKRTSADFPIILLIFMLFVTMSVTGSIPITLPQVLRLLTGIGLYFTILNRTTTIHRMRLIIRGLWVAGSLLALYAFISVPWNSNKLVVIPGSLYSHFKLLVGDLVNPNVMAGTLILFLPIALGLLFFNASHLRSFDLMLTSFTVFITIIVIVLSQSRGGILAVVETFALMIALRWRRGWWLVVGIGFSICLFMVLQGSYTIITDTFAINSFNGIDGRVEIWSRAVYMIKDFPFTGVGMGSYDRVAGLLYPFFSSGNNSHYHAHNIFLQIAVDLGIPGLIAWLAILFLIVLHSWQIFRHGLEMGDTWIKGLGAGFLCSQIALVSQGMLDVATWGGIKSAPLVWLIWGVIVAGWFVYGRSKD